MLKNDGSDEAVRGGVYIGVVTSNHDPDNRGRVKLVFPWMADTVESHWAPVASLYAGKDRGWYFMPEVGDEVLVVFEHGDINHPYVIASLWNGQDPLPEPGHPDGENNHKILETRAGHRMVFHDTAGAERIELIDSSNDNRLTIDVAGDEISVVAATGDIHIKAPAGSINFKSKTMSEKVEQTKQHTSGATHDITVSQAHYSESVGNAKSLTVGATMSRSANTTSVSASASMSSTGGSLSASVKRSASTKMTGPVTQTVGQATIEVDTMISHSPVKTWTIGMADVHAKALMGLRSTSMTFMSGLINLQADGQMALTGSPVIHLGGLINLQANNVGFKPGG